MDIQGLPRNSNLIHPPSSSYSSPPLPPPSDMGIHKRICILVFTDDCICQNIVSEVLQHCTYEVLHIGSAMDAINAIRKRKDALSLVLTNINRLKTKGAEIIQVIEKELNLRVCLMLPGEVEFDTRGKECKVSSYIMNFSDINDMKEVWKSVFEKGKARKAENNAKRNYDLVSHHVETRIADEPPDDEVKKEEADEEEEGAKNHHHKRKRKELEESIEESEEDCRVEPKKKARLNWNADMHQRFVQAIQKLGYDKAVPKKIVELMNEPGLTREHVASHLQKYRTNMRKGQECSTDFSYGLNMTKECRKPLYGACPSSTLNRNLSRSYSSPFGVRNNSIFSQPPRPLLRQSYCLNPNLPAPMSTVTQSQLLTRKMPFLDSTLHRKRMSRNGDMEFHSNFVPKTPLNNRNFRVYGDEKRSMLLAIQNRHPSQDFRFLGFRVVNDELQFGDKSSSSSADIQRESSSSSLTADWIPGNTADSVSSCSVSVDPILQLPSSAPSLETSMEHSFVQRHPLPDSFPSFQCVDSFISEQLAPFPQPSFYTPVDENSLQGIRSGTTPEQQTFDFESYAKMFLMDDQSASLSLPKGDSGNFSSTLQESPSVEVGPPTVLEIASYGDEEDISALLDAAVAENPECLWDDDFNDILFSITN